MTWFIGLFVAAALLALAATMTVPLARWLWWRLRRPRRPPWNYTLNLLVKRSNLLMATATLTPATTATPARSWNVPCPACNEVGALRVSLNALGDDGEVVCGECDHETTLGDLRALVGVWTKIFAWLDQVPTHE